MNRYPTVATDFFLSQTVCQVEIIGHKRYEKDRDRDFALETIRSAEPHLRQLGLASAALFGSLARGEASAESDIDIAIRPAPGVTIGPATLLELYGLFSDIFGYDTPVDVIVLPARDPILNAAIERDSIVAFT